MFTLKAMFRRMIETSAKSAWWTILLKLRSIIMCVILMVLIIVMWSVIASSVTMWSIKVTNMATATSTLIIAIVIIVIATTQGVKLSTVPLVLASINILLSPVPLLRPSIWLSTTILAPVGSMASIITSSSCCGSNYLHLHTVLSVQGRGRWLRLLLGFHFTFAFLSSVTSCTLE